MDDRVPDFCIASQILKLKAKKTVKSLTMSPSMDEDTSRKLSVSSVVKESPVTGAIWETRVLLNRQGVIYSPQSAASSGSVLQDTKQTSPHL